MKIEIKEPAREAFCREVVNVAGQHRRLLKKPERKLYNQFRALKVNIILCAALLALTAAMAAAWGADTMTWVVVPLMVLLIVLNGAFLGQYHRLLRSLMSLSSSAVLTIDEEGVELERMGLQRVRQSWSTVAFVRVFQESLCFVPKEAGGMILSVDQSYTPQVIDALRQYAPQLEVY